MMLRKLEQALCKVAEGQRGIMRVERTLPYLLLMARSAASRAAELSALASIAVRTLKGCDLEEGTCATFAPLLLAAPLLAHQASPLLLGSDREQHVAADDERVAC